MHYAVWQIHWEDSNSILEFYDRVRQVNFQLRSQINEQSKPLLCYFIIFNMAGIMYLRLTDSSMIDAGSKKSGLSSVLSLLFLDGG